MQTPLQRRQRGRGRKQRQRINFFYCLVFLICCCNGLSASALVDQSIQKISLDEKVFLKKFFLYFLKSDSLGHVLFFDTKPAAFTFISKNIHGSYRRKNLMKGWLYWKKNEHLFSHPNFIFIEEEVSLRKFKGFDIFLINKKTLTSCLQKNISLFREILGSDFSPENFITLLEKEKKLKPLIKHNEALFGVILGFGAESSLAFQKKHENNESRHFAPEWTETYRGVGPPFPEKCKIIPVGFMGNPQSAEVVTLVDCYTQELAELWRSYRTSKNLLKDILTKLCED